MGRILVTPRSITAAGDHPALTPLREAGYELVFTTPGRQPDTAELRAKLPGCAGYLAGVEPITAEVLDAARELRVISRNGVGVDNIDHAATARRRITICRAESANSRGVAELTIGLLFALARWIPMSDAAIKSGGWTRRTGFELEGRTLGVIGCGRIGRAVAALAAGLGVRVLGYDPHPTPGATLEVTSLDDLLSRSDVLTLHCPPAEDGRPILDAHRLSRTRHGVYLINTARHNLIDRAALRAALDSGQVAGVALDVFESEPPSDLDLLRSDRVIATPHIGGLTTQSVDRAVAVAVENLLEALAAAPPPSISRSSR